MYRQNKAGGMLARPLAQAALLAALLVLLTCRAAAGDAETQYIVKCSGSDAPFEVVGASELERLRALGGVEWYEPDGEAALLADSARWNLEMIGADVAYAQGCAGQGVRVAVLDSGVNPHPDFAACLLPGRNYMDGASDPADTADTYGHGTRVAGLVAGCGENGQLGVAPGVQLVPLKITDSRTVKISAVCRAIYGAIDDYGCRVLNLSLGVRTEYEALKEAVAYAEANGAVLVSAVGNGGTGLVYYPAAYDTVIGVGSVDSGGTVYSRSNHNGSVWLTAPGVDVRATTAYGGYADATGTSFSVPQVSGAAAVLLGVDPGLSPGAIRALLAQTARDAGAEGYDEYYGHGILDLTAALEALDGGGVSKRCSLLPATGPAAVLRNDADAAIECTYVLAYYDENGLCQDVKAQRLTLPAHGSADLAPPDEARAWRQFVYETDAMIPLAAARSSGSPGGSVPPAPAAGGFDAIGAAAGVTVEPCDAAGPVAPVSGAWPGSDRLRVTLADTAPWAQYVLTVSEAGTGKVLFADQRTGRRQTVFDVAFALPAQRTALCIAVGSDEKDFSKILLPLSYAPAEPVPVPGYVNCRRDAACPLTPYADLDSAAWYHDGVHWALETGMMNGVGADRFAPEAPARRAMLVTMLWRLEGCPAADAGRPFTDVAPDQWYAAAVAWAASEGLTDGYGDGRFGPDEPITREQLAVFLRRYAEYTGADVASGVTDRLGRFLDAEKIAPWALDALRWAVHTGLVQGVGPELLRPKAGATRAQTATVLMRLRS